MNVLNSLIYTFIIAKLLTNVNKTIFEYVNLKP